MHNFTSITADIYVLKLNPNFMISAIGITDVGLLFVMFFSYQKPGLEYLLDFVRVDSH